MRPRLAQLHQSGAADGQVVTWDDTLGVWVPADPTGGVSALDDLTDVDLTGVADGDFLQRVDGVWVPVDAPGGGGTPGLIPMKPGRFYMTPISVDTNSQPTSIGLGRMVPFYVPVSTTFDQAVIEVTAAAGSSAVRVGIYSDTNGQPDALVADWGTVATTTTGPKTISISETLAAGWYWLIAVAQGGTPTMRGIGLSVTSPMLGFGVNTDTVPVRGYGATGITGALPDPIGAITETPSGSGSARVLLRVA